MKRVFQLAVAIVVLMLGMRAHAATCPISSGASSSTIVSTIQGCASGNTVTFAPGSYSLSSSVNVPCGVSITGPAVAQSPISPDGYVHLLYGPTVIISATSNPVFSYGTCSTPASLEYLEVNTNRPSSGGTVVYASNAGGVNNLTISFNYFHGNNWNGSGECNYCTLIYFDGNTGTNAPAHSGDTISWNRFGANGDCASVMSNFSYGGYTGDGGYCAAVAWHNNMSNLAVTNNFIYYQEEGIKGQEGNINYNCVNCSIQANDISNWHRIAIETQEQGSQGGGCALTPAATGTNITFQYNSFHDPYYPGNGMFGLSSNNACQYSPSNVNPSTNTATSRDLSNVLIANVANTPGCCPGAQFNGLGIEFWSMNSSSVGNNNLIQGQWANSFMIGPDGAMSASNNLIQNYYGNACTPGSNSGGFFNLEPTYSPPANSPSGSGNSCTVSNGTVQTSAAPTISPASGTYGSSQVVTFTDPGFTSGVGPLGNTGIWYTTDGSTPVPGSGTAKYISTGGTITLTSTTTVKALGMWGSANQPASYPTGPISGTFGYQASAVVTASYTINTACPGPNNSVLITTYGGAVGDGSTDNTTAINNTFSYAKTNGCSVEIPAAATSFAHSGLLNMNGISVFGIGPQSILQATSASTSAVVMTGTSPSLSNLVILGTGSSRNTGPNQADVYVNGATGFTVTNVLANGGSAPGIWNVGGSNGTVTNNTVENTLADSITNTNGANQILDQNNMVYNSGDDGISNNSYTTDGNTVNNVTVNANAIMRNSFARGLEVSGGSNISFTNNYVDNESGYACMAILSETGSFDTQTVNTVTATGNTLVNCGPNQGSLFVWAEGSSNLVENLLFNGNRFNAGTQQTFTAVQVEGSGNITGSTVENSSAYIGSVGFLANQCTPTSNCTITQSGNVSSPVASYPGPLSPPIGGTVPLFSLPTGTYTLPQTLTLAEITSGDVINYCTVPSGTCIPSTAYSSAITISSPEAVCANGVNSSVSGSPVTSATICQTYNGGVPGLTLIDGYQANTNGCFSSGGVNTVAVGAAAVQQIGCGGFSDGSIHQLPYGGYTVSWSSANSAVLGVSSSGLITGVASSGGATINSLAVGNPGSIALNNWGWTVTGAVAPTLISVTITLQAGGTTVTVGGVAQACANMTYSSGGPTQVCGSGTDTNGTAVSNYTSSSPSNAIMNATSGLLTGVAIGTTNISVTAGALAAPGVAISVTAAGPNYSIGGAVLGGTVSIN